MDEYTIERTTQMKMKGSHKDDIPHSFLGWFAVQNHLFWTAVTWFKFGNNEPKYALIP